MKKSIFTKILCLVLLTTLFIVGCTQEEAEEMPDWNITVTPVNEAYSGVTSTVEVKVSKAVDIHLSVDGSVMKSTSGGSLVYDVSALPVGNHTVKVAVTDGYGVYEKSFSCKIVAKHNDGTNNDNPNNNPEMMYDYVDLGLPSGTLWATRNVGAENPWDYGDYFAWGETEPKEVCDWDNYTASDAPSPLDAAHDAATANWGINWRMPTKDEYQELLDNCEWEWTNDYNSTGVHGYIVWDTYFHKTHIFLPSGGYRNGTSLYDGGSGGYYWSSSLVADGPRCGRSLYFRSCCVNPDYWNGRGYGFSVRPVRCR